MMLNELAAGDRRNEQGFRKVSGLDSVHLCNMFGLDLMLNASFCHVQELFRSWFHSLLTKLMKLLHDVRRAQEVAAATFLQVKGRVEEDLQALGAYYVAKQDHADRQEP